ncbi:HTH-type transcriptional repressor yvoA [Arachnia propionica]|nr:HTH-type transcriptional repressor yvoA [Arachnia propionica]
MHRRIAQNFYRVGDKLPSEPVLAKELGVSRVTVRAALTQLENEGLVDRRHGSGTYVNSVMPLSASLHLNVGADSLIRSRGLTPGVSEMSWRQTRADEVVASKLGLDIGTAVIHLYRVRTADGIPVTIEHDYFADSLIPTHPPNIGPSLYAFLSQTCGVEATHGVASLEPALVGEEDAAVFGVRSDDLCLVIRQVDYDAAGHPVSYSVERHLASAFDFRLLRQGPGIPQGMPSTDR